MKGNIIVNDSENNTIKAEDAEYLENKKILRIIGPAEIITAKNYILNGKDITLDDLSKKIVSNQKATIIDKDDNKIYLENFEYTKKNNLFKSVGLIKLEDKNKNIYEFSQIYIDTNKKEIFGTDAKSF